MAWTTPFVLTNIDKRREEVCRLYLQQIHASKIAKKLGISKTTVFKDMQHIRKGWRDRAAENFDSFMAQNLARIDAVEAAAYLGWKKSRKDEVIHETRDNPSIEGPATLESIRRRGQAGDNAFLATILKCVEQRRKFYDLKLGVRALRNQKTNDGRVPHNKRVIAVVVNSREEIKQVMDLDSLKQVLRPNYGNLGPESDSDLSETS